MAARQFLSDFRVASAANYATVYNTSTNAHIPVVDRGVLKLL